MSILSALNNIANGKKNPAALSRKEIVELLKTSPEKLEALDCDKKEVLGIHPYWDPDVMKKRFDEHRDGHDEHDAIVYRAHEETLMARYNKYKDVVLQKVKELLPDLDLAGQWSLDIMQNGDEFWLIDMALAQNSAFYQETVKLEDRRPEPENWIPQID